MFQTWSRRARWILSLSAAAVVVAVVVLAVVLSRDADAEQVGALATDATPCHHVGEGLLRAGGNAVDVAVGVLLCEGVSSSQSMGLGGGFIMTIYDRNNKKGYVLNARETAPGAAHADMFGENKDDASVYGGLAIAVPGELVGYWQAHQRFGRLPWATVVEPTIAVCERYALIQYQADMIAKLAKKICTRSPELSELLLEPGWPARCVGKKKGDLVRRPKLAETMRIIAREGGLALNNGSLTAAFAKDLNDLGSIITEDDLRQYKPVWSEPVTAPLPGGLRLLAPPPPGSGPLLAHFLMLTAGLVQPPLERPEQFQKIIEAMKFVFAARTDFGDEQFEPNATKKARQMVDQAFVKEIQQKILDRAAATSTDTTYYGASWSTPDNKGTAHVSVATADFAVSVTSTVNTEYGCMLLSPSTGIIMNDEMDDFSLPGVNSFWGVPPSPANFIKPHKRPMSSMTPAVIVDADGDVRLVIGGSGGTRITSAVGLVSLLHLYLGVDLDVAVQSKRFHHQLMPMAVQCEKGYPEEMVAAFRTFGHNTTVLSTTSSSVMAVGVRGGRYRPAADLRREGVTALVAEQR